MPASFVWQPGPNGGTPTNAANLNRLAVTADIGTPGTPAGDAIAAAIAAFGAASKLTPTATKTAPYTAAVNDLAVMNVAGGATTLTLPTAPADKAQVAFLAIGATAAAPLTVNRGGSDTIGPSGATSVTAVFANEVTVYQYQAASTRWLPVANVKPQAALDARYSGQVTDAAVAQQVTSGTTTTAALNAAYVAVSSIDATPLTKADIGLGNVDNTADVDKPISAAAQAQLDALRQPAIGSGVYIYPTSPGGVSSTTTLGVGNLRVSPWLVTQTISLAALLVDIGTAGEAGAKYRMGIYSSTNGYPGALVVDTGQVAADAAGVIAGNISTLTLTPGLYWIGGAVQTVVTTQPSVRIAANWNPPIIMQAGTSLPGTGATALGYSTTGVTAALPATFPANQGNSGTVPRILAKTA